MPASDLQRALDIIASTRTADRPATSFRPAMRTPRLWRSVVVVGLSFMAAGAVAHWFAPDARGNSETMAIVGALFASLGAVVGVLVMRRLRRARDGAAHD